MQSYVFALKPPRKSVYKKFTFSFRGGIRGGK
jgi:hypothetical protein